ncbi:L-threonylcarbamoyladenylate synthase [Anabaena subtropica]|uniref:L-threonylcarbamoyladenylate synthase n=1 Tax=Anabaena subtropica FACHB-260 TaxID=2692884 RepID=A0ABR8CHN8_9NOST|nr:L-threonylcarbamoyladenylate synthase [Anabaena subtropica]MBD2342707.1 threonylcarbamoyl-AMP synthase [Anabaena subtropica FACHB-260]
MAKILKAHQNNYLEPVINTLQAGGVIIAPTPTNYCIVCDATNAQAVDRVFRIKQRTKLGPLPVLFPNIRAINEYVQIPDWFDRTILDSMLPGEISFIFWQRYPFPEKLTCGLHTVAVNCTTHSVLKAIVSSINKPLAASSANISGQGNIFVTLEKAIADIGDEVDLIIDAGETPAHQADHIENRVVTIVDLTFEKPFLCRPGWVPVERVLEFIPNIETDVEEYKVLLTNRAQGCIKV